jgi:DNA-binding NarL/FixJ family response regulator
LRSAKTFTRLCRQACNYVGGQFRSQVREVVEDAVQDCPRHRTVRLISSEDFRLPVTSPPPDIVLINLTAPPKIREQGPDARVIFLSQSDDIHLWAEAIQLGAYDFLPRSVECHQLAWVLQDALWNRLRTLYKAFSPDGKRFQRQSNTSMPSPSIANGRIGWGAIANALWRLCRGMDQSTRTS